MLRLFSVVLFVSSSAHAAKFDAPDLNFEYQLHRQYLNALEPQRSAEVQPIDESGEGLMESYSLQQGENLWGLSQMLYGDGAYWPKVWAQNKNITNPHLIRKGHTLQFLMGSEDQAPAFRFSEEDDSGIELAAAHVNANPQIEIPPPEIPPRPVLKVPNSFPEWQDVFRKRPDKISLDDSRMDLKRQKIPDKVPLSAYVQEKELVSYGSFLEAEKESGLPVVNQYVYVKLKKGVAHIGEKMLIVSDMGNIRKLNSQVEGEIKAHFIQVYGEIQLTDTAEASFRKNKDTENFDVYRALILQSTNLTHDHFDLIPGQLETVDLSANGPSGTTSAQLIGSYKLDTSAIYGPGDVVFLNKGTQDGVEAGQIFDLYIDRSIRDERTPVTFSNVSSGMMKIAKVSTTCSTGVILNSIDSIQQGDRAQQHVSANEKAHGSNVLDIPSDGGDDLPMDDLDSGGNGSDLPSDSGDDSLLSE